MEQKTTKLYPSAPLEKIDLEQRLEKKLIDVNCSIEILDLKTQTTTIKKRLPTSKVNTINRKRKIKKQ